MKGDKRLSAFAVFREKRKMPENQQEGDVVAQSSSNVTVSEDDNDKQSRKKRKSSHCKTKKLEIPKENLQQTDSVQMAEPASKSIPETKGNFAGRSHPFKDSQSRHANFTDRSFAIQAMGRVPADVSDSRLDAKQSFEWLIHPVQPDKFFRDIWEKKPLLLKRHQERYYRGIFSCRDLDKILRERYLNFTRNIDITSYTDGERKTLNPDGRAYAAVVWDYYQNGCSVRLLNPQTYSRSVWKLNSTLQEYFGSFVGANVYLTPRGSQGFAPHFDDIEAFVLQLEGKKFWKLYSPRSPSEQLPQFSSRNFNPEEIGDPILSVELNPGDLLYFPRGYIHQAATPEDTHSLHVTLSTCQKNAWGVLLEKILSKSLATAFEEDIEFRQSLPRDYQLYMGVAHSDVECPQRDAFLKKVDHLMDKLKKYVSVDTATDQMVKGFIHDALPPVLTEKEKICSIHGAGEHWEAGYVVDAVELEPSTKVKIIRSGAIRLLMEEDVVRVYHTLENSRVFHENEPQYIEVGAELAPAVEYLIHWYPECMPIEDFPLATLEQKMEIANLLYDKGLLVTSEPLEVNE